MSASPGKRVSACECELIARILLLDEIEFIFKQFEDVAIVFSHGTQPQSSEV